MQDSVLKIGDIRLLCRQHFEQTGDKLSFIHAYRMAACAAAPCFSLWAESTGNCALHPGMSAFWLRKPRIISWRIRTVWSSL